jgi:hypothetical protein
MRLIVRRTRPGGRHKANSPPWIQKTGWRYAIVATNIGRIHGVPGSHHPQWIDTLHRHHAVVEDRVRTNKATGLRNLPSRRWTVNRGWALAANLAADIDVWTRLLGLHDQPDLAHAEPRHFAVSPLASARPPERTRPATPAYNHPHHLALAPRVHPVLATSRRPCQPQPDHQPQPNNPRKTSQEFECQVAGLSARCDQAVASSQSVSVLRHPCRMPTRRLPSCRKAAKWLTSRALSWS